MLWKMALRNMWRQGRRTLLSIFGIGFALGLVLVWRGMEDGAWQGMVKTAISASAGHVVVQAPGFQEERDAELVVVRSGEVAETLARTFEDGEVVRRSFIGGLLTSPVGSAAITLHGIEPDREAGLTLLDDRVVEGAWLEAADTRGALIGQRLAQRLDVGVGDKLVFMAAVGDGEMESRLFRVAGIYRGGSEVLDAFTAFASLEATQELLPGEDPASQVAVILPDVGLGEPETARAEAALGRDDIVVMPWSEALATLKEQMELDANFSKFLYIFMALIVAVGILNAILMGVMERIREFGVMLALGMRPRAVASLILLESALIGLGGGLAGVILGFAMTWPLAEYGIDYGDLMAEAGPVADVPIDTVIRAVIEPDQYVVYAIIGCVASVIAALWPAWLAMHLRPVDAIRHQ